MPKADTSVIVMFHSCGVKLSSGMGIFPLTWAEIKSFSDMQDDSLTQWECEQLAGMSREYCSWIVKGKEKGCDAPWHSEEYTTEMAIEHDRARVVAAMMKQREERKKIMQKQ